MFGFLFKSDLIPIRIIGFIVTAGALGALTYMILVAAALTVNLI